VTGHGLVNLCLPRWMGGLGVEMEPMKVTVRQRTIAWSNVLSNRPPVVPRYEWVPFQSLKTKSSGSANGSTEVRQIYMPSHRPRGVGPTMHEGHEHYLETYSSSVSTRALKGSDWIASMSRMRYKGRSGRIIQKGSFFKRFASISSKRIQGGLARQSTLPTYPRPDVIRVFGSERRCSGQYVQSTRDWVLSRPVSLLDQICQADTGSSKGDYVFRGKFGRIELY
jgi:hypothetical protein